MNILGARLEEDLEEDADMVSGRCPCQVPAEAVKQVRSFNYYLPRTPIRPVVDITHTKSGEPGLDPAKPRGRARRVVCVQIPYS